MTSLWIAAGGAAGTLMRYWIGLWATARFGETLPWGTIGINITGSFVIGLIAALSEPGRWFMMPADLRLFLTVGICGGYTTFSSFSLQTLALLQAGSLGLALINVVASVVLCLLAVWLGYHLPSVLRPGLGG